RTASEECWSGLAARKAKSLIPRRHSASPQQTPPGKRLARHERLILSATGYPGLERARDPVVLRPDLAAGLPLSRTEVFWQQPAICHKPLPCLYIRKTISGLGNVN